MQDKKPPFLNTLNLTILGLVVLFGVMSFFFSGSKLDMAEAELIFKCPEEMNSFEEYAENRAEVGAIIYKQAPDLSTEKGAEMVVKIAEKKGCTNDVEYFQEAMEARSGESNDI